MPYKDPAKQKQAQSQHYKDNKGTYYLRDKNRKKRVREEYEAFKKTLKCEECGEKHNACLSFHHTDPTQKDGAISEMLANRQSMQRILEEVKKCRVLCLNCHAKLHWALKHPDE